MQDNQKPTFLSQSLVSGIRTMVDGGIRIQTDTQELSPEDVATLFSLRGKLVWQGISEAVVKDLPKEGKTQEGKSPSQRLRNVLFIHWTECTDKSLDFDTYYAQQVEKYITLIKEKLPEKI